MAVGLALAAPGVPGRTQAIRSATITVTNCNDNGPNSLRLAVETLAADGGTVDLSGLECSRITLTTGEIVANQNDLTILGPGESGLTIDGGAGQGHHNRVFAHNGTGTLTVTNLAIGYAEYTGGGSMQDPPSGGCIDSNGSVSLFRVRLSDCSVAVASTFPATGGGLATSGTLTLRYSSIADNVVRNTLGPASGGGAYVDGDLLANSTHISGNQAEAYAPYAGSFGGLAVMGDVSITASAITGNHANAIGGMGILGSYTSTIVDSTISGNTADQQIGGVGAASSLTLANSTVAFNSTGLESYNGHPVAAGVYINNGTLELQSSIIANNSAADQAADVVAVYDAIIDGANNLVVAPLSLVPADTIVGADPLLGPLGNHGGSTPTHAIGFGSPAIDVGNNNAGLNFDQRGAGFPRTLGGGTDIGAFEFDPDRIFADGFDS